MIAADEQDGGLGEGADVEVGRGAGAQDVLISDGDRRHQAAFEDGEDLDGCVEIAGIGV